AHAPGCDNDRLLPVSTAPLQIEYRAADGGEVLAREGRPSGEVMWLGPPAGVPADFRARLTTTVRVEEAGWYELGLASAGLSRLALDGEALIDNWTAFRPGGTYFGQGSDERRARRHLDAGEHAAVLEFAP